MKCIIAGSRSIAREKFVLDAFTDCPIRDMITEIVSGGARGVDSLGESIATYNKIKCSVFKAEWDKFGLSAGYKRNRVMGEYADAALVVWDSESKGTKSMINIMKELKKPVYVYLVKDNVLSRGSIYNGIEYRDSE